MKKQQLTVYLHPETMGALLALASRTRAPVSTVAEAAIGSFVTPDEAGRQEALIVAGLDRIARALERLERDQSITVETLALFVRHWLQVTPVPEQPGASDREKGAERFEAFTQALSRRLRRGRGFSADVSEEGLRQRTGTG